MKKITGNKKKINWMKVYNDVESNYITEYNVKIIELFDSKEERFNKVIWKLHELLNILKEEKCDDRSYKITENSGEVYQEVIDIKNEMFDEIVEINNWAWHNKTRMFDEFKYIVKGNIHKNYVNLIIKRKEVSEIKLKKTIEANVEKVVHWTSEMFDIVSEIGLILREYEKTLESEENKKDSNSNDTNDSNKLKQRYLFIDKYRDMVKYLNDEGYVFDKVGRHHNFIDDKGNKIPVPRHSKDLGKGISIAIQKEIKNNKENGGVQE